MTMIDERIAKFAARKSKAVSFREAGAGQALILLHGIGSSSASWLFQLESLKGCRLIAWDAPGYGDSDFLNEKNPTAGNYSDALHGFLERLLLKDVVLVGNSLGCLMATAYAAAHPERVRSMILLGPAGGYGNSSPSEREEKLQTRLKQLDDLGPEGLAEKRSPTLVAASSPPIALELVRWSQRRIRPDGYRQVVHCLASGRLADDARQFRKKVLVACGSEDVITPEAGCKAIAAAFPKAEYRSLAGVGHAPHVEDPTRINAMIAEFVK
jgi:pimeloyl-ACP methyl ester carboxylesterase